MSTLEMLRQEGMEKAMEKVMEEKRKAKQKTHEMIRKMLKDNKLSTSDIARYSLTTEEEVLKIKNNRK